MDETEFSRNSIYNRLEILEADGHVELVHGPTRLFAFIDDPREKDQNKSQKEISFTIYTES